MANEFTNLEIPGFDEPFYVKDIVARDMLLDVTQYGVDNTGTIDITNTVNQLIADHPHSTLYFKAGEYEIDGTIVLPSSNAKRVHIWADKAAYFRKTQVTQRVETMIQVGDNWSEYNRQGDRPLTFIIGGVWNGYGYTNCFNITQIQCVFMSDFTIIAASENGIYLTNHLKPDAFSCNAYIQNGKLHGNDGSLYSVGIHNESYDNSFSHLMVDGFQIGVTNDGGGGVFDDVHVLGIYSGTPAASDFNNRTGFYMPADCRLVNCYADSVGLGFGISASVHAVNTFYYNLFGSSGLTPRAFSFSTDDYANQADFINTTIGLADDCMTTLLEVNLPEGRDWQNAYTPRFKNLRLLNLKLGTNCSWYDSMFRLQRQDEYLWTPLGNNAVTLGNGEKLLLGFIEPGRGLQNIKCLLNGGTIDIDFVAFDSSSMTVKRDDSSLDQDIIVEFINYQNHIAIVLTNQGMGSSYAVCCDGFYFGTASNAVGLYTYPFEYYQKWTVSSGSVLYTIHAFQDHRNFNYGTGTGTSFTFHARGFATGNNGVIALVGNGNDATGICYSLIGLLNGTVNVKHLGDVTPTIELGSYSNGYYTINVSGLSTYTEYTLNNLSTDIYLEQP